MNKEGYWVFVNPDGCPEGIPIELEVMYRCRSKKAALEKARQLSSAIRDIHPAAISVIKGVKIKI